MSVDNVIGMERPKSSLLNAISRTAKPEPAAEHAANPPAAETPLPPEELPLPSASDAYAPHSRIASRPLAAICFIPRNGLPDCFSYSGFERVRMVAAENAGASPVLLMRFNGSVIYEALIEGRNLMALCNLIGRQVIHWIREHPTGRDEGGELAVFIRRITIREIERG